MLLLCEVGRTVVGIDEFILKTPCHREASHFVWVPGDGWTFYCKVHIGMIVLSGALR